MKVFGARVGGPGNAGGGIGKRVRASAASCRRRGLALALGACVLTLAGAAGLAPLAYAAGTTYTVNSTADPGDGVCDATECTLREAIDAANANPGADTIDFAIPGPGPYTIEPTTALPTITDPVTIDGTTQPGFAGTPIIEISGASAPVDVAGLTIDAGSSTVRGLVINRFLHSTTNINGPEGEGIVLEVYGGNVIEGNYLGTDVTGTVSLGNHTGIRVSYPSTNNQIGGATSADRNLVSGNNRYGIYLTGFPGYAGGNVIEGNYVGLDASGSSAIPNLWGVSFNISDGNRLEGNVISGNSLGVAIGGSGNTVQGNMIGTNPAGTSAIPNSYGLQIIGGAISNSDNMIGGTAPGQGNVISGNTNISVLINSLNTLAPSTGNRLEGNRIGVGTDDSDLGNGGSGVVITSAGGMNDTTIGGTSPDAANIIAYNGGAGVAVDSGNSGERVLGNSIHSNDGLGIDLSFDGVTPNDLGDADTGPNSLQNFPVVTSAANGGSGATISGSLNSTASTTFRLEFFASETCDSSGYGEGELYLGADSVTTDAGGDVSFASSVPTAIPSGWVVTATATDPDGNTSEFSACSGSAGSGNSPPTVLSAAADASGDEGSTLTTSGSFQDSNGDSLTISGAGAGSVVDNGDGTWSWSYEPDDNGTGTVTVTADDGNGGTVTDSFDWTADNVNPDVTLTAPTDGALYQVGASVGVSADLTDPGSADTHTCSIDWNDSSVTAGAVSESNGSGTCSGSHTYSAPGVYAVGVTVTDDDGGTGSASVLVVVYDPSGGFVTGGGWIDSPAGAYKPDATLTGHATFGFVSKYKKGATTPDGNTEFQFTAGNLSFHSSSYDWLVVSKGGGRAQFKGTGTINGSGSYGFMLWATDGSPDAFRIQIWDKNDGDAVVYDNGTDADGNDTSFATGQPLAGGSIVVHDK